MKKLGVLFFGICFLSANPTMLKIINEFQVAPENSERIEFKQFETQTYDTLFQPLNLYNTRIGTPAGTAVIDTAIILSGTGFAVIDTSVLSGPFDLPDDSGFIDISYTWYDYIQYPRNAPTPFPGMSLAKFYCYSWDSLGGFCLFDDWYIDITPTFGGPNDDYPGCQINGHVWDAADNPIPGCEIIASVWTRALLDHPPFYKCCTTYTALDGTYIMDSLLPLEYWVKVVADYYFPFPDSQFTFLTNLQPQTVNFYLVGKADACAHGVGPGLRVEPNPFRSATTISMGHRAEDIRLSIYDATGKFINSFALHPTPYAIRWEGTDQTGQSVPSGVYFVRLGTAEGKQVIKVIRTK
jgi:hypothetical protein